VVRAVAVSRVAPHGLLTARASAARKRPADLSSRAMLTGLHDRLGEQADPWSGVPSSVELALSESLQSEVRHLALSRNLTDARFKTALRLFEDARSALPHRIWFLPLGGADELRNAVHNEESFGMLAEFKMRQGSLQPGHMGEPVRADTVAGYISALRVERGLGAGYIIAHSQTACVWRSTPCWRISMAKCVARVLVHYDAGCVRSICSVLCKQVLILGRCEGCAGGHVCWSRIIFCSGGVSLAQLTLARGSRTQACCHSSLFGSSPVRSWRKVASQRLIRRYDS
jgi:hypothetical protein